MFCCPHCSRLLKILNNVVEPESDVTMLNNIVDNIEQCGQQNIVQSCSHQPSTGCSFFAVYITQIKMNNLFWPDENSIEQC